MILRPRRPPRTATLLPYPSFFRSRKLDEIKPNFVWWSSISQVPDLLGSGEVVMSVTSPGRLVVANRTEGRHFKLRWDGNIYAVDYWVILANSPRKQEAEQLLRFMTRSEEHTSELQSLMRISYAVFCLKKKRT